MAKRKHRNFKDVLSDMLSDPDFAAEFLSTALEEEDFETFMMSLRDVIRVHGTVKSIAEKSDISRTTLYNMFSEKANPELKTLMLILHTLGYDLKVIRRDLAA